jgi:hypothetical protein
MFYRVMVLRMQRVKRNKLTENAASSVGMCRGLNSIACYYALFTSKLIRSGV